MTDVILDAPRPVPGTGAATTLTDRNNQLAKLMFGNYSNLTGAAYAAYKDLFVMDCERIIYTLGTQLHRYTGPAEEQPFLRWATRFVVREARRFEITARILVEQKRVIYAAIRENRWMWCADYAVTNRDIFMEVAALIHQRALSLNRRGRAKLSTRIMALVKKHMFFHNQRNARRYKLVQERVEAGLPFACEQFSDEELADMRSGSQSPYDSGYAEIGLLET